MLALDVPADYTANPHDMPRPYVQFEMRPVEVRDAEGNVSYKDIVWAKVTAPGAKDVMEKAASEWIQGLEQHAKAGRIPPYWPGEYTKALQAYIAGESLEVPGTPIKSWPPLSPAQRKNILSANILTVEDLAQANDEMKTRIGMGANTLVQMAQKWVEESKGPGKLAAQLQHLSTENTALKERLDSMQKLMDEMKAKLPAEKVT